VFGGNRRRVLTSANGDQDLDGQTDMPAAEIAALPAFSAGRRDCLIGPSGRT
jgi:hypothetical protein